MSVVRVTTITFESNQAADIATESYVKHAQTDFPDAEQLLGIQSEGNMFIAVSLYADNEAMERATATRGKALASIQGIASVDTRVGTVELNCL